MAAYYNEFNPEAAAWLRELIKRKLIAVGEVDERSIIDVQADDIRGFVQCHFFAGIGGWSYALRLAGIPDDYPLWTASLPCQPFSVAGKQLGKDDERHLLPHFTELVRQCKPNRIFGEQVEGAIRHGWLDDLQTTMEAESYAVGHCILGAHSVGSHHLRQRLYWIANKSMGNSECKSIRGELEFVDGAQRQSKNKSQVSREQWNVTSYNGKADLWAGVRWIYCKDGKYRAIEPSIKPLVNGIPKGLVRSGDNSEVFDANNTQEARTMRLKGYGNAIVPQVAALFISAATLTIGELNV
jgi:DNA (cytosine-5)-methyltransferase 1